MVKKNVVFVTGATGFIGSHLVKRLNEVKWDVHIIKRTNSNLDTLGPIKNKVHFHTYDGTVQSLLKAMSDVRPDTVFHLASFFTAEHEAKQINDLIQSNIQFSTHLLEAMTVNNVRMLVNTGTSWQHYQNQSYSPVCLYAATKQAFEAILKYYSEVNSVNAITLKLFDTYGPNDTRKKLFNLLDEHSRSGKVLAMSGGDQLIDLVYIDDVIDAYLCAANLLKKNNINHEMSYCVTSGSPIKLKEIVQRYCQLLDKTINIKWGVLPYRHREVMIPWSSGTILPGWSSKVSLDEGFSKMEELKIKHFQ
jgi:nucleoside-diphosphate-sugar epimerase